MTYTGQNLEVYQGKDRVIEVQVLDGSEQPLNITGSSFNWVVYRPTPGTIVLSKTSVSGISLTVPVSGYMEITLVPADTQNLLGIYQHEGEITTPTGEQDTIFTGYFRVYASKT